MASKIKVDQIQTADGTGTIALQNQLSGMTSASMPTGSVLQVVQTSYNTQAAFSSTSLVAHGASATITPSSTSSKILISAQVHRKHDPTNGADSGLGFAWKRGSTTVWETPVAISDYIYQGGSPARQEIRGWVPLTYLDSPSTTSATTYALWARAYGNGSIYFQDSASQTIITLMEIAG